MSRPIAPLDLSFLLNDTRDCPQHVSGVLVFENPRAGAGWTIADLVGRYRAATPVSPFDAIPEFPLLGRPRWVQVREFDMRYHVQHVGLPAPGTDAQLDELVQQWHSDSLDRHRPLFQMIVVEGLEGNRFAIFAKVHHAIVDGASAIMRLLASLSPERNAPVRPPLFAVDPRAERRRRPPPGVARQLTDLVDTLGKQASAAGELSGSAWSRLVSFARGKPASGSTAFEAPASPLNAPVRYGRSFAHLSLPIAPLHEAAKARDGTLNDAVLAIVDDAVVRYLEEHGHAPREPLHALVPVSLRDEGATQASNRVSGVVCPMGDPGSDARTRLGHVVERMRGAKGWIRGLSKTAAEDYFVGMFFLAQGLGAAGVRRTVANFVVSNIPGSPIDTYLGGSRLLGVYPMNVLTIGLGLSVTLVSRAGQLDIGLVASRSVLPDPGRLAKLCREAANVIATPAHRPAKRSATRRSATAPKEADAPPRAMAPKARRKASLPRKARHKAKRTTVSKEG